MKHFFLPVKGYEGRYAVSDTGQVKSLTRITPNGHKRKSRILKLAINFDYQLVNLSGPTGSKMHRVNRLVAIAFLPNLKDLPDVHHRDHNKSNNSAHNLSWVTATTNMREASAAKKLDGVSRGFGQKLTMTQVEEIRARVSSGERSERIGPLYGVTGRTVRHITTAHTWDGPRW